MPRQPVLPHRQPVRVALHPRVHVREVLGQPLAQPRRQLPLRLEVVPDGLEPRAPLPRGLQVLLPVARALGHELRRPGVGQFGREPRHPVRLLPQPRAGLRQGRERREVLGTAPLQRARRGPAEVARRGRRARAAEHEGQGGEPEGDREVLHLRRKDPANRFLFSKAFERLDDLLAFKGDLPGVVQTRLPKLVAL